MKSYDIHPFEQQESMLRKFVAAILMILFVSACIFNCTKTYGQATQTGTGIIKGTITDETGEGLIGATVQILDSNGKSTGRGTAANFDGDYILSGLPWGVYDLRYSSIGLRSKIIKGVPAGVDPGTCVDIKLSSNPIISCGGSTTYKRPLISRNNTEIGITITKSEIRNMGF